MKQNTPVTFGGMPGRMVPRGPGVYRLTNVVTGDSYVGASIDMYQRRCGHGSNLTAGKSSSKLQKLHKKHGMASFVFDVLEECPIDALNRRERAWIRKLKPTLNTGLPSLTYPREAWDTVARRDGTWGTLTA